MFTVKICGVTTLSDALHAAQAGADAVGLNLYPASSRYLPPERAAELAASLPRGVAKVGLFVNASAAEVIAAFDELRLDYAQLHGDEPPQRIAELAGRPAIKAFRLADGDLTPVAAFLAECRAARAMPAAVLLDGFRPGQFGGTGALADWSAIGQARQSLAAPLILAGGLRPDNVAEAIRRTAPQAVDVSSGVETAPGRKCRVLMSEFVAAARNALAQV